MIGRKLILGALSLACLIVGCSSLTPQGQRVKMVTARPQCESLGIVNGSSSTEWITTSRALESAQTDMRNDAAEMGADTVYLKQINRIENEVSATGEAFRCGK